MMYRERKWICESRELYNSSEESVIWIYRDELLKLLWTCVDNERLVWHVEVFRIPSELKDFSTELIVDCRCRERERGGYLVTQLMIKTSSSCSFSRWACAIRTPAALPVFSQEVVSQQPDLRASLEEGGWSEGAARAETPGVYERRFLSSCQFV